MVQIGQVIHKANAVQVKKVVQGIAVKCSET